MISVRVGGEGGGGESKIYSLVDGDGEENKKAKGVNRGVVRGIQHKKFIDVFFSKGVMRLKMKRMQSKLHRIRTYDVFKISLSCFDDKRYILDDGVNSLAYFCEGVKSQ